MDPGPIFALAAGAGLLYLTYDTYYRGGLEWVVSRVDGQKYQVLSLPDKQAAADLLAEIVAGLNVLLKHLEKTQPSDARTLRIVQKFDPTKVAEEPENNPYTSYSINKGERLVFCLRSRDAAKELSDLNTMMFVAIHEFAHIATEAIGHPPDFWVNFRWLLAEAVNIGVFRDKDYKKDPQPYCGIKITDNPLHQLPPAAPGGK
jgi:hypothetical protein